MHNLYDRTFKLWDYSPSFNRLLLRSPQNQHNGFNLDIIFYGVQYLDIASLVSEVEIIEEDIVDDTTYRIFVLKTKQGDYKIQAASYKISQSDTDIFESPLSKL